MPFAPRRRARRPSDGTAGFVAGLRLPTLCAVCHGWGRQRVCETCVDRYVTIDAPRCRRCALRVPAGEALCGACLLDPPAFVGTVAAVDYGHPWDGLISRFKFHGGLDLTAALALRMLAAHRHAGAAAPELLLPVPLSDARLRERGYNQAWELARRLGRSVGGRALPELLLRTRDTAHQLALLPEERAGNVHAAFAIEPRQRSEVAGRAVTVVDDVMTTGATAAEIARVLLRAGASAVHLWVMARTPRPGRRRLIRSDRMFNIVLVQPEIPPNTGNVIRLAANTGCSLHLVEPLGFSMEDRQLRRAGLDYHEFAPVRRHASWPAFLAAEAPDPARLHAFTTSGRRPFADVTWAAGDWLVFGSETAGLPAEVRADFADDRRVRLPLRPGQRSLNLSNAVAVAVFEAWRQIGYQGGA